MHGVLTIVFADKSDEIALREEFASLLSLI